MSDCTTPPAITRRGLLAWMAASAAALLWRGKVAAEPPAPKRPVRWIGHR